MSNSVLSHVCDEAVFKKVFDTHFQTVRNFIYIKCKDEAQADDLTQDAFVKLWNNCKKVTRDKAVSYLFTITKNAFFNAFEHQKVVLKYKSIKKDKANIEDPEFLMREKEFQAQLNDAINQLSDKQREVFLLNRIEKKKYREIAELLDISVKSVETRMQRALEQLRASIKNYKI
ncbi:RNA polymerase sigma factor [Winogradskyella haliclonae]|uniref:DNA-directed RNA polymerase sigma-70 factor n=1 Tax=Winogradskyella haliclonae TaxID=2048558 RepID=A0ABQ2BXT9_9FLAO|nr:RNA polymerase sigma-70 factor [Winogradskyella haliclonae]GGI55733.1 DNA-directed RNA polymerase sigma-70 factor [Winogradskyella haliclonae]